MVIIVSPSAAMRASSLRARAGMMALMGRGSGGGELGLAHGEPETVGGGQGDLVVLGGQQHAGQHRAGFVGGGGKGHLLDHLFEIRHVELDAPPRGPAPAWAGIPGRRCT